VSRIEIDPSARKSPRACPLPLEHVYAMPVELADLDAAAARYAQTLKELAGVPPVHD